MIGFFDSGFGGLTILRHVVKLLPQYDYLYLGDNARIPYGSYSDTMIYKFTKQAIKYLLNQGCILIIIACNTASAKALRKIQKEYMSKFFPDRKVLGVIIPMAEKIIESTKTCEVGILATEGTVFSKTYIVEIKKLNPCIKVIQQACPLLVPIIEAGEQNWKGTNMIIKHYLKKLFSKENNQIDTIVLACTHYPILYKKFVKNLSPNIMLLEQGPIIAQKLFIYLSRHPEIKIQLKQNSKQYFITTDKWQKFDDLAIKFYGKKVNSKFVSLI